ncbi:hypothetical protein Lfu02_09000 [Longispora fulva]|uniref:Lipoprotein n=1 Tax=Longispora fulva TaxID=619741 RepID=A0A8J7KNG9_9ACTN|nr:hypothetical protein [Longispora fulva]MBG6135237.1 hypothetical protein [Longispora fulva]GIG56528.1 hypothetical protein Lfu02_09000 [Longispora fulva]
MKRRLFAVVAAAVVLGTAGGCDDGAAPAAGGARPTASASPSPTVDPVTNRRDVCGNAAMAMVMQLKAFNTSMQAFDAAVDRHDDKAAEEAERPAAQALADLATAYDTEAGHAVDPKLKSALTGLAGEYRTASVDLYKELNHGQDTGLSDRLRGLTEKLGTACPGPTPPPPVR